MLRKAADVLKEEISGFRRRSEMLKSENTAQAAQLEEELNRVKGQLSKAKEQKENLSQEKKNLEGQVSDLKVKLLSAESSQSSQTNVSPLF